MFEIEKKFFIKEGDFERLTKDAEFVNERTYTDTYYDDENYSLTKKDIWLRKREDKFQTKIPFHKSSDHIVDQYNELETKEEIRSFLNIQNNGSFEEDLKHKKYYPFCSYKTTRKKYRKGDFVIDFDLVDFGDFKYEVLEIELLVKNESEIEKTSKRIIDFAKKHSLKIDRVRGKVKTYLSRNDPKHFQALIEAGV